jgi:hypothetical protein
VSEKPSDVLSHNPSPQFTGDTIPLPGTTLAVFSIPSTMDSSAPPIGIATDNPDGYSRLVREGIEGIADGESVTFAQTDQDLPRAVRVVKRIGSGFSISKVMLNPRVVKFEHQESTDLDPPTVQYEEAQNFFNDLSKSSFGEEMDIWRERNDKLGETVQELGFTDETYPLPSFIRDKVLELRAKGIDLPRIKIFHMGNIDRHTYVETWSTRHLPTSVELSWVGHDFTNEHLFGLLPFGDDAMEFGGLYADALKTQDSIHAMLMPEGEGSKELQRFSGEEKFDHGARVLDTFSVELSFLSSNIDKDPETVQLAVQDVGGDLIREMATVIMDSPEHAEQFREYLEAIGSTALNEDGVFSPDQFRKDLLKNAQKRWEIKTDSSDSLIGAASVE